MVRWFIQHQKIRPLQGQLCQRHAAPFTTTQRTNGLKYIIARKEEASQKTTSGIFTHGAHLPDLVNDGSIGIQSAVCLRVIANAYIVTGIDLSADRWYFPNNRAQQRGLTRAVRTKQTYAVTSQQFQVRNTYKNRWLTLLISRWIANGELLGRKYNLPTIYY